MKERKGEYVNAGFYPWRRYFARSLDVALNSFILHFLISIVFHYNLLRINSLVQVVLQVVATILMLAFEPIYLHYFGTTFGKWVFGLSLENDTGEKLSLQQGFSRSKGIFIYGFCLGIPFLDIYAQWKSYNRYQTGEQQPWEEDGIVYIIKDAKWYRGFAYILIGIISVGLHLLLIQVGSLPPVRGDLNISGFSRNYNYLDSYYSGKGSRYLNMKGAWEAREAEDGVCYADMGISPIPIFKYKTENGSLKEVRFEIQLKNSKDLLNTYLNERLLSSYAFAAMQKGGAAYFSFCNEIKNIMKKQYMEDFTFSKNGITCINQIEYSGYEVTDTFLFPTNGKNNYFHLIFTIKKAEYVNK